MTRYKVIYLLVHSLTLLYKLLQWNERIQDRRILANLLFPLPFSFQQPHIQQKWRVANQSFFLTCKPCMTTSSTRATSFLPRAPLIGPHPNTPSLYNPHRLNAYTLISWKHTSYHRQIITVRFNINTDMAEHYQPLQQTQLQSRQPRSHQVVKAATAVTAGGSLLVLSGLTMAGTVIALTIATPLLVICSPVLVPAVITVSLLIMGFLASGGFGVAAISVLSWIYRYWI